MIVKEFQKEIKGQKRRLCIKRCDECGFEKEVHLDGLMQSRLVRKSDIDLCRVCAGLRKYKGISPRGVENKNFKHGLNNHGYRLMTVDEGRKCFEHQYLYEKYIGRELTKKERIHHIDLDKLHNEISNLYLCNSISEHYKCHHQMETVGYSLLNKKIWFDSLSKKYVLNIVDLLVETKIEETNTPKLYKIYNKHTNSYSFMYAYKNENNEWRTRAYHVALMEKKIGRKLFINECVHHINGNPLNNMISNLSLVTRSEHTTAHISLQHCVAELYKQGLVIFKDGIYSLAA